MDYCWAWEWQCCQWELAKEDMRQAIKWGQRVWNEVPATCVQNCWGKVEILPSEVLPLRVWLSDCAMQELAQLLTSFAETFDDSLLELQKKLMVLPVFFGTMDWSVTRRWCRGFRASGCTAGARWRRWGRSRLFRTKEWSWFQWLWLRLGRLVRPWGSFCRRTRQSTRNYTILWIVERMSFSARSKQIRVKDFFFLWTGVRGEHLNIGYLTLWTSLG